MKINVILAPCLLDEGAGPNSDQLCVVLDVLRATTTITMAIESGAIEVYPCLNSAEVNAYLESKPSVDCLLGGEVKGEFIPGFDLGNSPIEYMNSEEISGKTIVLTTSNGTPVIRKTYDIIKQPVYLAAMVNLSAVSAKVIKKALQDHKSTITIICSGRYDNASLEDTLCAGLIVNKVKDGLLRADDTPILSDSAIFAECFAKSNQERIFNLVSGSETGRFLNDTGFTQDVSLCCRIDISQTVPVFLGDRIIPCNES